jgi:hypothetical protein
MGTFEKGHEDCFFDAVLFDSVRPVVIRSFQSTAIHGESTWRLPGLICPPLRPVAPLHNVRASRMTTVRDGSCSYNVRATLVPVIPLPIIATSAASGHSDRYDANRCGGVCQYDCVGFGGGRVMIRPRNDCSASQQTSKEGKSWAHRVALIGRRSSASVETFRGLAGESPRDFFLHLFTLCHLSTPLTDTDHS